jgi:hypothetical protein
MSAHNPDDVIDPRGISKVVGHFAVPAEFVTRQPALKSISKRTGNETLRRCFTSEERSHISERHVPVFDQPEDVVEIPALNALDHTTELLRRELFERVDIERNKVR